MKIFAVLLLCSMAFYARSEDEITKEKALEVAQECKEETGATDADIEAMFKHEASASAEAKCLRSCVMTKFDIMNADGKMVKESALNFVKQMANGDAEKEALGEELVEACAEIEVSDDHCEAAEEYGACLKKEAEAKGLESF